MERYRTTIIMAVLLIVLGGAALFLSNSNSTKNSATPTPTPVVYVWQEPNPVKSIDVVSGTTKVSLVKDPTLGTWTITQPINKPADLFSVSGVADSLQNLQAQFSVTGTTDLAQFGLGANSMSVALTFSDTQGTKRSFNIGKTVLDGSGYYVKTSDSDKIYVIPNATIEPLRTWLTTPPIQQPTPTPLPITQIPLTATPTPTETPAPTQPPTTPVPLPTVTLPAPVGPSAATATP